MGVIVTPRSDGQLLAKAFDLDTGWNVPTLFSVFLPWFRAGLPRLLPSPELRAG